MLGGGGGGGLEGGSEGRRERRRGEISRYEPLRLMHSWVSWNIHKKQTAVDSFIGAMFVF